MKRALLIFLLCFGMIFENTGTAFAGEAEAATGIETETDKETKTETDTEPGGSEEKIDISSAILTELVDVMFYGEPREVYPVVWVNGKRLTLDVDYTCSFEDNTAPGNAKVIVTGIGDYTGVKTGIFRIISFYHIIFMGNGGLHSSGADLSSVQVRNADAFFLRGGDFRRPGYEVASWNTEQDGSGVSYEANEIVTDLAGPDEVIILYAQWELIQYRIHVDLTQLGLDDGDMERMPAIDMSAIPKTYTIETETFTIPKLKIPGFRFVKWRVYNFDPETAVDGYHYSETVTVEKGSHGRLDLSPVATPYHYTLRLKKNNGTGAIFAEKACVCGEHTWNLLYETPERRGYIFVNWNSKADGSGTSYGTGWEGTFFPNADNEVIPLYAQWKARPYRLRFDANGGTGAMPDQELTYGEEAELTANVFTRSGYRFDGWNTRINGSGTSFADRERVKNLNAKGAVVFLHAQWKGNPYTIRFNAHGGTGTMADREMTCGQTAALPKNAYQKTGFHFAGWNTKADGSGTFYANEATVNDLTLTAGAAVTLYAQWEPNTYTIRFGAGGGRGTMPAKQMTYGKAAALPAIAYQKTGYHFAGWNTKADGSGTAYGDRATVKNLRAGNGAVFILYAQWKPNSYTIRFSAHGGTGTMAEKKMIYDRAATLPANAFDRTGYSFAEWNTKADGSGTSCADRATVKNLAAGNGEAVTLYARWKGNTYIVRFGAGGGSGTMPAQQMTYGQETALSANAYKKTGHHFTGWNTRADGSGTAYADRERVKNLRSAEGDVKILVAQWEPNTYTIRFGAGGGRGTMSAKRMTYGKTAVLPAIAYKKTGYHFAGWNTKADGSGTAYADQASVKNLQSADGAIVILYAQWKPNTYTIRFGAGGGRGTMPAKQMTYGKAAALPAIAYKKTGYHFAGWTTKADGSGTVYANGATVKNLRSEDGAICILYAQWKPNTYTIRFSANGGSGSMADLKMTYGKSAVLTANAYRNDSGFAFAGWNTKADGSGTFYADKTFVKNLTSANGAVVTLYAQWSGAVRSMTISGSSTVLTGLSITLTCRTVPAVTTDRLSWSSSNTAVATVNSSGVVKGINAGTVTITVTASSGVRATKTITVQKNAYDFGPAGNVSSYKSGVTIAPKRLSYSGGSLVLIAYVINNSSYTIDSCNNLSITAYSSSGRKIAARSFGDVDINLGPYAVKTLVFSFPDAATVDLTGGGSIDTSGTYWFH